MASEAIWAAGVYVREHSIACVVGEVVLSKIPQIGATPVPRTKNRDSVVVPEVSCLGKTPEESILECARLLKEAANRKNVKISAVHIACFGGFLSSNPADKYKRRSNYGVLTNVSAYENWEGVNLFALFKKVLCEDGDDIEIDVGTDVDAAAYGEFLYESRNVSGDQLARFVKDKTLVCLNFSRSINGGIVRKGELWMGEGHPMMSIIRPPKFTIQNDVGDTYFDLFEGSCEYHKDCIEGLIGVSALEERTEMRFEDIPPNHEVWELVSYYVAQMCIYVVGILKPSTIILTGRTIRQLEHLEFAEQLVKRVRGHFYACLTDRKGECRPNYRDLMNKSEFIRLPRRHMSKKLKHRLVGGVPGRHGALRMAEAEAAKRHG